MTDGDRRVLDGIDLLAHPVPPLGVVGENGAGQSTPMRNRATVRDVGVRGNQSPSTTRLG